MGQKVQRVLDDGNIPLIVVTRRRAWPFVSITTYIGPILPGYTIALSAPVGFKEKVTRLRAEGGGKIETEEKIYISSGGEKNMRNKKVK